MTIRAGYWVDLQSVTLNDPGTGTWIQAMPLGTYTHPVYGSIEITPERVQRFAANVKEKVRGTDLDIDYDHKEKTTEAAGWVKDAEARSDGLWIFVDWTKDAYQKIKDKAFRYFSPEFVDEWVHPKTSIKYQDVLFGGGITNRPFLKDILPINMSELFEGHGKESDQGGSMDPKLLRKFLGLAEDATDEQVNAAIASGVQKLENDPPKVDPPKDDKPAEDKPKEKEPIAASELPAEVIKLAENNPAIKALVDSVKTLSTSLGETQAALRLAEVNNTVRTLTEAEDGRVFPPSVKELLSEVLLTSPKALSDKVQELFKKVLSEGLVELGERGHSRPGSGGESSAAKRFNDRVQDVIAKDKMSYADAVTFVAAQDPKLYSEYQTESYAFREN